MAEKKKQIVETAGKLLDQKSTGWPHRINEVATLKGDGSQRTFYRLLLDDNTSIIAIEADTAHPFGSQEAASAWHIGVHLHHLGVPVPEPLAFNEKSSLLLFEDLGDTRLYDLLQSGGVTRVDEQFALYRDVIRELVHMQVKGIDGFDPSWCWQTEYYNRELMLERESGYFFQSLCRDFCGLHPDIVRLNKEFVSIAESAAQAPAVFFLHRDFQSRNIMLQEGKVRIIDFQGGRLGPLAYDLASLLIDPYASLNQELQEALFNEYLLELGRHIRYDRQRFREEYLYLSLQRNLQILGAFAYLAKQEGKEFFLPFIRPSLASLQSLLGKVGVSRYPVLGGVISDCYERIMAEGL